MATAKSPIVPADLNSIASGSLACDKLAELSSTRDKFKTFLAWLLADDASGELGDGFLLALAQQFLFDASKKGYIVGTDATTGYLTLFQYFSLASLDPTGAAEGDTIYFDATAGIWKKRSAPYIYLAPTSGGTTIPSHTAGGVLSVAHGLSNTPTNFKAYLECTAADVGYAIGDRVQFDSLFFYDSSGPQNVPGGTTFANATTVGAVFRDGGGGDAYRLNHKSTMVPANITEGSWNVFLYASL